MLNRETDLANRQEDRRSVQEGANVCEVRWVSQPSPIPIRFPCYTAPLSFTWPIRMHPTGALVTCVIEIDNGAICCETFDICPQLGRFTLRDEGKTIGIGKILEMLDINSEEAK